VSPQGSRLSETELIGRFFARAGRLRAPAGGVLLGIGDDAALLQVPEGSDLVAAVDTIVAGRHFLPGADAFAVGHRALAVNLSDLAAMGASPRWATLALTLPAADPEWLERFAGGLFALADRHGVALVGGDTTSGPLTISVQLLGVVDRGAALRRDGAKAGDLLAVTGSLGDAGAGLALSQATFTTTEQQAARELVRRFDYPAPRVEIGAAARGIVHAAMDLSDGLVADLPKLTAASGLAAHVEVDRLPLSPAMQALGMPALARDWALGAGDDYELLFAVPRPREHELREVAARFDIALTVIGELRAGAGVTWSLDGAEFAPRVQGYDHFR
jgi:thiamine-monophosphate kinase